MTLVNEASKTNVLVSGEKYLFVMCIHTEVDNVCGKTGKTVFTVRSSTQ